jgi:nitrite reductase/ring-hydroxylating ferredoxin subunit
MTLSSASLTIASEPQLLLFQYRSKIHAVDHSCPHRSFPLSSGSIYDIEDFGIVLSAGIACPKHGWTFDLFTGESDRAGGYRLGIWEVDVRGEEVWVRRRQKKKRIG